jgi:hypothetical protein
MDALDDRIRRLVDAVVPEPPHEVLFSSVTSASDSLAHAKLQRVVAIRSVLAVSASVLLVCVIGAILALDGARHSSHRSAVAENPSSGASRSADQHTSALPSTKATSAPPPERCLPDQLSVTLGRAFAASGTESEIILMRSNAKAPCSLSGYLQVTALDASGTPQQRATSQLQTAAGGAAPGVTAVPLVTLSASDPYASALIVAPQTPIDDHQCIEFKAYAVGPPAPAPTVTLPLDLPFCGLLLTTPIVPGETGTE